MEQDIPKPSIDDGGSVIPSAASNLPENAEDPEVLPLLFSFEQYKGKECQIDTMEPKKARKALKAIRDIGINIKSFGDFAKKLPKLEIKPVRNEGGYRCLFSGLNPDADLHEIKTDKDTGRIFFQILRNTIFLIAVRDSHYETDKQKR